MSEGPSLVEILGDLAAQHAEIEAMVAGLGAADLARPTRCVGWDVSDVLVHLAQTDDMATASAEGWFAEAIDALVAGLPPAEDVDDGAGMAVARDRGAPAAEVRERWRDASRHVREALSARAGGDRVEWVAGDMTVRTLAVTRLTESWIHAEDIADALGCPLEPTDRLRHTARLAWRTVPYAFARAGRTAPPGVRFALAAPSGATWVLEPDGGAATAIEGPAVDLCRVAGQRVDAADTALVGTGPRADEVLELVRTFA